MHTPPQHPDHAHLSSALSALLAFRDFLQMVRPHTRMCTRTEAPLPCSLAAQGELGARRPAGGDGEDDPRLSGTNPPHPHPPKMCARSRCVCVCVCVRAEPEGRQQAAHHVPGGGFAQESRPAASRLAQVTVALTRPPHPSGLCKQRVTHQELPAGLRRGPLPLQRCSGAESADRAPPALHAAPPQHAHLPGLRGRGQPGGARDRRHSL